jgi:hypothetical protein
MEINGVKKGFFLAFSLFFCGMPQSLIQFSIKCFQLFFKLKSTCAEGLQASARGGEKKMMECADDAVGAGTVGFSVAS